MDKKEITKEQMKEVNAIVKFKMEDVKTCLRNRIGLSWQQAFQSGQEKYAHYWEAFEELERIIDKEANMPLPSEMMSEDDFRIKRDKAVNEFVKVFRLRETGEYHRRINSIVKIVEDLLI